MRKTIGSLLNTHSLDFDEEEDRTSFEKLTEDSSEWTAGPVFLSEPDSETAVMVRHHWRPEKAYHYLIVGLDFSIERDNLEREWSKLIERAEKVVSTIHPDLSIGWAQPSRYDGPDPLPVEAAARSKTVLTMAPWNYVGAGLAKGSVLQLTKKFSSLCTGSSTNGLFIRPVPLPGLTPEKDLLRAMKDVADIEYRDPLIEYGFYKA